jgi:hypothetical protein
VIWLLSYIHSAYIHSWHDVIYEKSKTIHHSPSPHDVSLSSPNIYWQTSFKFPFYDTMALYSKQSFFMCLQTIFPCLFRGFFPSDLDYNISYTDPRYLEQTSGKWKMPSKVGNIALKFRIFYDIVWLYIWHMRRFSKPNIQCLEE